MYVKVWQSPAQRKFWQNGWISEHNHNQCLWTMLNNPELLCHTNALCARERDWLSPSLLTNKPQKLSPLIPCRITRKKILAGSFQDYLSSRNPLMQVAHLPPTYPNCFLSLWSKNRSSVGKSCEHSYGNPRKMLLKKETNNICRLFSDPIIGHFGSC